MYLDNKLIVNNLLENEEIKKEIEKNLIRNKKLDISNNMLKVNKLDPYLDTIQKYLEDKVKNKEFLDFNTNFLEVSKHNINLESNENRQKNNMLNENWHIRNLSELSYLKNELFDNKYGIINNIYKDINSSEYCIVGAEFSILESKENIVGYGRATTFQEAENIAILEAIERFCMFNIENCTHRGILKEVIENPYIRNELKEYEDENIYYIEAHNYKTNDSSNIPLQFVDLVVKDNKRMVLETSNGTAIGTSYHEAMLYALLEFIERDAFLTFWHKKVKLDMIDVASLNVEQKNIIENFENEGKKVYLFDMAIDIDIPTILCLIISNKEKPATYVSSGTHIDPELAVDAALKEAIVAHNIYRTNNAVGKLYNNKFEVEGLSDHFNYYSHPSKITTYDWLIETSEKKNLYEVYPRIEKNFSDVEAVEFVIKKMENIKEIYSVLLENRFIQNKGLYVVKVVIPEMQTMYFGYKNKRININRLDAAINNSKHKYKVEFNRGEYYDEPHPFP